MHQTLLLLWCLPMCASRTWSTALVEGYSVEWKFVAKFAFTATTQEAPGIIHLRAWTFMSGQRVLLYENDAWFHALGAAHVGDGFAPPTTFSDAGVSIPVCEARASLAFANASVRKGRFYGEAGNVITSYVVQPKPSFTFLALARCASWVNHSDDDSCTGTRPDGSAPNGVFLYYELMMLNPGDRYWRAHFSADEMGLFEFHIAALVATIVVATTFIACAALRFDDDAYVTKLQSLASVLACLLASHLFSCVHYMHYARDGIGKPWAVLAAEGCEAGATVLLTLTILLVSKGWMVSRARLKRKTRMLQGAVTFVLTGVYAAIFLLEMLGRDPAATYHKYESDAARVLAVLRVLIAIWFIWCVHRSYKRDGRPEARRFYSCLLAVGGLWLLSLPLFTLIATWLPSHLRLRMFTILLHTTTFLTLVLLSALSFPRALVPSYVRDGAQLGAPTTSRRAVLPAPAAATGSCSAAAPEDDDSDSDASGPALSASHSPPSVRRDGGSTAGLAVEGGGGFRSPYRSASRVHAAPRPASAIRAADSPAPPASAHRRKREKGSHGAADGVGVGASPTGEVPASHMECESTYNDGNKRDPPISKWSRHQSDSSASSDIDERDAGVGAARGQLPPLRGVSSRAKRIHAAPAKSTLDAS